MTVVATCQSRFVDIGFSELEKLNEHELDALPFGVIGMSEGGIVEVYNQTESKLAGLSPDKVLGAHFFSTIAQCMNNYLVAQRFIDEPELDTVIDFVLTLRMRPTPVKLRLMKSAAMRRRYILLDRS
ncbi:MAG: phosphonate transporter [Oxalobacteraceae bacterium]|nr:MAG: phosphonate transporter [Oxalobacteraceae bacterium]